ncbi:NAD(P)H-binding protein [Paenibacillus daejeonensis]|uniref:NAD(P)H-binding protein n=1 Tax=Paenibacillus daejeonensis TaxID=135193 RepID=UPI00036D0A3D|nr:NAD(P)H-binding protein [Paenibacillus daejeonensis]
MTILVTGATGTVGRHLVEQLLSKGEQVRALSRNPERAGLPPAAEVVKGDLMEPASLIPALTGVQAMYLFPSSDQEGAALETPPEVVKLVAEAGVQRMTYLTLYGSGPVEEAIQASGMQWTFLQPVGFMANALDDWQAWVRKKGEVSVFGGHVRTAIIHEADIAAVASVTLLEPGHHERCYTLTGPELISPQEQVALISQAIGRPIAFISLSEQEARARWEDQGYDEETIAFFVEMNSTPPEIATTVAPTVEQITGRPAQSFATWVEQHRQAFL